MYKFYFYKFYGFRPYIWAFNPFLDYFYKWCEKIALIFLHVVVKFFQHHLLKRLSFPTLCPRLFCYRIVDSVHMGLFLSSLFCSIDLCICFQSRTTLLWLLQLCFFESRECDTSSLVLSQDCFGYFGSLYFHIHFRIICSGCVKNAIHILIKVTLNLWIAIGSMIV